MNSDSYFLISSGLSSTWLLLSCANRMASSWSRRSCSNCWRYWLSSSASFSSWAYKCRCLIFISRFRTTLMRETIYIPEVQQLLEGLRLLVVCVPALPFYVLPPFRFSWMNRERKSANTKVKIFSPSNVSKQFKWNHTNFLRFSSSSRTRRSSSSFCLRSCSRASWILRNRSCSSACRCFCNNMIRLNSIPPQSVQPNRICVPSVRSAAYYYNCQSLTWCRYTFYRSFLLEFGYHSGYSSRSRWSNVRCHSIVWQSFLCHSSPGS